MVSFTPKEDGRKELEDARAAILLLLKELETQVPRFRTQPHMMTTLSSVRLAREWLARRNKGQG